MQLEDNEIHIWCADTNQLTEDRLTAYRSLMSVEELERNKRYRFERDQRRDCLTRALARTVLSEYENIDPVKWEFIKGDHGKPELLFPNNSIRFNLSHTSRYVVCAVTRHQDVGIDVEHTERKNDVIAIAKNYFSTSEVEALFKLNRSEQSDQFFDFWTLKEAYMKARGEGIALGLGNFSFDLSDSNNISISFAEKLKDTPDRWRFWLKRFASDHRMALAYRLQNDDEKPVVSLFETIPLGPTVPAQFEE